LLCEAEGRGSGGKRRTRNGVVNLVGSRKGPKRYNPTEKKKKQNTAPHPKGIKRKGKSNTGNFLLIRGKDGRPAKD